MSYNSIEITDPNGIKFPTLRAFCAHWDISYTSFHRHYSDGMNIAEAIEYCKRIKKKPVKPKFYKGIKDKDGFLPSGRVFARLQSWGVSSSDIERIGAFIQIPSRKIAKNKGRAWCKMEAAFMCPRCDVGAVEARWAYGFTLKECALSSRLFSRLLLERFHV